MTVISGLATVLPVSHLSIDYTCVNGLSLGQEFYEATLPARSTSMVLVPFVSARALWRGLDLRPTFILRSRPGSDPKWIAKVARGPALALTGRPQAHVRLTTSPRGGIPFTRNPPRASLRRGVRVFGTVDPPSRGRLITLRVSGPHEDRFTAVATTHTARGGRFSFDRFKPSGIGYWQLAVAAAADRAASADTTCPRALHFTQTP